MHVYSSTVVPFLEWLTFKCTSAAQQELKNIVKTRKEIIRKESYRACQRNRSTNRSNHHSIQHHWARMAETSLPIHRRCTAAGESLGSRNAANGHGVLDRWHSHLALSVHIRHPYRGHAAIWWRVRSNLKARQSILGFHRILVRVP